MRNRILRNDHNLLLTSGFKILFCLQPWTIIQSKDAEEQRNALSMAISTIFEGNVPDETRTSFMEVMGGILDVIIYPLTSTQLGLGSNFLDMRKLDVLKADDARAKEFKIRFLDIFVEEHEKEVVELNEATPNFDYLFKKPVMGSPDEWYNEWMKFCNTTTMIEKQRKLRSLFRQKLESSEPITEPSSNIMDTVIRNNPRLVAGTTHALNLLGLLGAFGSILKAFTDADSGFRKGDRRDRVAVLATAIGGVGSIKGSIDLAKAVKRNIFKWRRPLNTWHFYLDKEPEELAEVFQEGVATEYAVELNSMERISNRMVRMMNPIGKLGGTFFTALGVHADGIFFGLSVYDLVLDFAAESVDPWKVANDFALAASSGVGAVLGK